MKKLLNIVTFSVVAGALLSVVLPASAQTISVSGASSVIHVLPASAKPGYRATSTRAMARSAASASTTAARIAAAQQRAGTEIANRITALNNLASRIESMTKLSDSEKSSISSDLQSEVTNLSSLQGTINTDVSTTSLKTDMQSITKAYRVYALVVPQGSIAAAADRVNTLVTSFTTIAGKLQTRITAASAGNDVSSITSALTDLSAKVSDAGTQASAATSEVANLQPDNGDATILASNTAALKDARAKLQTATQDLETARTDANTIVKALQALPQTSSATTTQ